MEGKAVINESLKNLKGKILTIPQADETLTKKGYFADAQAVGKALEERVEKNDIVDSLTSNAKDRPLSANQGTLLRKLIKDINTSAAGTVGYDNTSSGLTATNMQSAVDEVAEIAKKALPQTGGTINGYLHIKNVDNGLGWFGKNHSATEDYGTHMTDVAKDGKSSNVSICSALGTFTYTDPEGNIRDVFHEGTKPFGHYVGNGSANERIIETKGIGRLILVYNSDYFSFVTPEGALVVKLSEGTIRWIDSGKVYYLNGNLGLNLTNEAFNEAGKTYYYQAI